MKKFTKAERSGWRYFFAHWCAFQMVAIMLNKWKFRYLFHDFCKPWLKTFGVEYKKIQFWHRHNADHHIEYLEFHQIDEVDWYELIIDWECSKYTKEACPRGARDEMEHVISNNINDAYLIYALNTRMRPKLDELGL